MTGAVLGVVVVIFNTGEVVLDCLESLLADRETPLSVVVVDNASTDRTADLIEDWAAGRRPWTAPGDLPFALAATPKPIAVQDAAAGPSRTPAITLIRSGVNGGFAAGVNIGLAHLAKDRDIGRFWVLNPDGIAAPGAARAFATWPAPGFSLMGGRVTYVDPPGRIQIDGGTIDRRTGVTGNINLGRDIADAPMPEAGMMDFITGASMVASRAFYETVGPLREDYFLYYEEVDWALRRGTMPLAFCPQARVYHRAGTAIGSPTLDRIASPFSLYFKHRARLRFVRRFLPLSLPTALAYTVAKAGQYALRGHRAEARATLAGAFGGRPPEAVRAKLSKEAAALAFAPAAAFPR